MCVITNTGGGKTNFLEKHEDAFRRSSLCDLHPHAPASSRPHRGRTQKSPPCQDRKRLRSPVPSHLVGSADRLWGFPTKLLLRLRYGSSPPATKTPRDHPIDYPPPRKHCLGMESAATRTPSTHNNLPAVETCATSTRSTLQRLAPPSPSPYLERITALPTGAMAHAIVTQRRLSRPGRRIPRRQDHSGRSLQGVAPSTN